jgi:hypothetical protein
VSVVLDYNDSAGPANKYTNVPSPTNLGDPISSIASKVELQMSESFRKRHKL